MEEGQTRFVGIERPKLNTSEVWTIVNTTGDAHPIHLHLTQFRILNRQKLDAAGYLAAVNPLLPFAAGGTGVENSFGTTTPPDPTPYLKGHPAAPDTNETGFKDTVKVYPGELVRIVAPFGGTAAGLTAAFKGDAPDAAVQRFIGTYVWHCHILEHEEHDMMRPFLVQAPAAAPFVATVSVPAASSSTADTGRSTAMVLSDTSATEAPVPLPIPDGIYDPSLIAAPLWWKKKKRLAQ
jgi:hypothetical protein